jgi:hypothetical protein
MFSHFDSQGTKLMANPRFVAVLKDPRVVAWYWGHEHPCIVYEDVHPEYKLHARCMGNGGMPHSRAETRHLPRAQQPEYAAAQWVRQSASARLPSCVVLEGPNPYIKGEEDKFVPHGYGVLKLEGTGLHEEVHSPDGKVVYARQLLR